MISHAAFKAKNYPACIKHFKPLSSIFIAFNVIICLSSENEASESFKQIEKIRKKRSAYHPRICRFNNKRGQAGNPELKSPMIC